MNKSAEFVLANPRVAELVAASKAALELLEGWELEWSGICKQADRLRDALAPFDVPDAPEEPHNWVKAIWL